MNALLMKIPDELKPWAAMGIGSFILVFLVLFHGLGLHRVLAFHVRGETQLLKGRPHAGQAVVLFGLAVFLMLSLHLAEVIAWGIALLRLGLIQRTHDAFYFCANAYTTLGYGSVDLTSEWRNISPIIGISGLFTFAWTTSALVNVVGAHNRLLAHLHAEREKQKELRADLRKGMREVRKREKDLESAVKAEAQENWEGASLRHRWEIWRDEKGKVLGLRKDELKEIAEMYQKEQAEEDKLGPREEWEDGGEKG